MNEVRTYLMYVQKKKLPVMLSEGSGDVARLDIDILHVLCSIMLSKLLRVTSGQNKLTASRYKTMQKDGREGTDIVAWWE